MPLLALLAVVIAGSATLLAEGPTDTKASEPKFTAAQVAFFENDVKPLLETHCLKCHGGGDKVRGGLRLTSREEVLKGGDSGPAVDLKSTDGSLLLKAIKYGGQLNMPPKGKLGEKEIKTLVKWVGDGLPYPSGKAVAGKEPKHKGGVVTAESRNYWAYRALTRSAVPAVKEAGWVVNPIDAFILAKLEAKELKPNAPADRVALIRRVYYDLTGLPPTPKEIAAFLADKTPQAYEKLIDKLLDSPHYGEKWGRHWLDLVRYAETNGYERDGPKPFAWRFRDYVIRSFNADKPYDVFVREQIAGDELPGWNADAIIATGYYRLGLWDDEPVDPAQSLFDDYDDIVATTGQVFLGMTMNCARCHDHKIDPIPQADYYRLLAFFADIPRFSNDRHPRSAGNMTDITPPEERVKYEAEWKAHEAKISDLTRAMALIEDEVIKRMPAEDQQAAAANDRPAVVARKLKQFIKPDEDREYQKLKREVAELKKKEEPHRELALSVNNGLVRPPQTFVLTRGNVHAPGAKVEPGFPAVLGFDDPKIPAPPAGAKSSLRRTALANWLTSKDNPLPARVMANRLWQHHFGRGIVASSNDFGQFGTSPTHPELLDWLAKELQEGGWKLKRLHKLILMSNTYQQASTGKKAALAVDPENHLWWRYPMRRLTAEEMRDSILSVSGKLNEKMFGESVYPPIPKEVFAGQSVPGQGWGKSSPEEASRRSVYVHIKRSLLVPILSQHDQADTDSSCPVRYTTTVPTTALGMLNGEFTNEQAGFLAERLKKEVPNSVPGQIKLAIALTTGRQASESEVKADVSVIEKLQTKHQLSVDAALKLYCLLVLNANEFAYID
jgi:mono/diheme cytochrome c family protein